MGSSQYDGSLQGNQDVDITVVFLGRTFDGAGDAEVDFSQRSVALGLDALVDLGRHSRGVERLVARGENGASHVWRG